jgi:hypothetical protein
MLVMEDGDGLQLALGSDRSWLASGQPIGIAGAPTHFGRVSWQLQYDAAKRRVAGRVEFAERSNAAWTTLHLRLPAGQRIASVNPESGAAVLSDGSGLILFCFQNNINNPVKAGEGLDLGGAGFQLVEAAF